MAGGGGGDAQTLQETPTWALAAVCAVLIAISIVIEQGIHKLGEVVYIYIYLYIKMEINYFWNYFIFLVKWHAVVQEEAEEGDDGSVRENKGRANAARVYILIPHCEHHPHRQNMHSASPRTHMASLPGGWF